MAAGETEHEAGEALWRFSLAFYARPGVAPALLALQDRAGLDVNVILFAVWLGAVRGRRLDAAALAAAGRAAAPLREGVIAELRGLRRRLRADPDPDVQALRRRILALELAAERRAQHRLAEAAAGSAAPVAGRAGAAAANLALCLGAEAASGEAETLRRAIAEFTRRF